MFYKITSRAEWNAATANGQFLGSVLDLKDGFIHLSAADQVRETARLHFDGQADLVLVAVSEMAVAKDLKWEVSRGGKLFPHVYAALDPAMCVWVKPLAWNGTAHEFPREVA